MVRIRFGRKKRPILAGKLKKTIKENKDSKDVSMVTVLRDNSRAKEMGYFGKGS